MGMNWSWGARLAIAAILATASAATGCKSSGGEGGAGGEGGSGGAGGTGGLPDVVDISDIEQLGALVEQRLPLVAEIQSVAVDSPPTVEFTVRTQSGVGVVGIPEGAVRGTFAKLVPPAASPPAPNPTSSKWVSYINQIVPGAGANPALPEALQTTWEQGPLIDNGDGSYRFTYSTDVTAVTDPVAVAWEPDNTTRAGLEIRIESLINPDNPHYDFVPSGGAGTGSRDISATALCNNCHQRLSTHASGRFAVEYCVTCHNDGNRDPDTGEPVSMAYMVHSIHASGMRALAGTPYVVIGPSGEPSDYSRVTYPQDLRECESCHNGADASDGDAWTTEVNALACGGCHAGSFVELSTEEETGIGSYSIQHVIGNSTVEPEDAECRGCHNNPTAFPDLLTAERHVIPERIAAEDFEYNIIDVTDTNVGQMPSITFSVTNPKDGSAYDLNAAGGPFDTSTRGEAARLAIMLAWPSNEYNNIDTGSELPGLRPGAPAQNVSIDPLGGNCPGATCVDNANGTYTITSPVEVPAGLTGDSLAVAVEGHPALDLYPNLECFGGGNAGSACSDDADCPDATCADTGEAERLPVAGVVAYYAVSETGGPGEERALGVSLEKCADCHGSLLSEHGSTNSIALCVTCHNANATDIRARAEAGTAGEQSIDFTTMIHAIHAAEMRDSNDPYVLYGAGGSRHDYSAVTYPGSLDNCGACHVGESYYPVDPSDTVRFATTYVSDNFDGADLPENVTPTPPFTPLRTLTLANQEDDLNQTTNAAACLQCHVSQTVESHSIVPGGAKLFVKQDDDTTLLPPAGDPAPRQVETCVFCHGPGSSVCEKCDTGPGHMPWFPLD